MTFGVNWKRRGSGVMEIFPSLACDDVRQIRLQVFDEADRLEIQGAYVDDFSVTFVLPSGESSSLPLQAIEVSERCGWCELASPSAEAGRVQSKGTRFAH